jgi:NAD+ synthase
MVLLLSELTPAVTSTLCAKQEWMFYVEMPIHQHASHVNRAKEHIAQQLKKVFKM